MHSLCTDSLSESRYLPGVMGTVELSISQGRMSNMHMRNEKYVIFLDQSQLFQYLVRA